MRSRAAGLSPPRTRRCASSATRASRLDRRRVLRRGGGKGHQRWRALSQRRWHGQREGVAALQLQRAARWMVMRKRSTIGVSFLSTTSERPGKAGSLARALALGRRRPRAVDVSSRGTRSIPKPDPPPRASRSRSHDVREFIPGWITIGSPFQSNMNRTPRLVLRQVNLSRSASLPNGSSLRREQPSPPWYFSPTHSLTFLPHPPSATDPGKTSPRPSSLAEVPGVKDGARVVPA